MMSTRGILLSALLATGCATPHPSQGATAYAPVPEATRPAAAQDPFGWSRAPGLADHGWSEWFGLAFGERAFESALLPAGASQLALGVELWGRPHDAWIGLDVGLWASAPWDGSLDDWADSISGFPDEELLEPAPDTPLIEGSSSLEFSIGARRDLWLFAGRLRPYIAGGLSAMRLRTFSAQGASGDAESDGVLGVYGRVGLGWVFANGSRLGVDWRRFEGPAVEFAGQAGSPNYDQWSLSFGAAF